MLSKWDAREKCVDRARPDDAEPCSSSTRLASHAVHIAAYNDESVKRSVQTRVRED